MACTIKDLADVKKFFKEEFTEPIFYICTDPLQGLGLGEIVPNYHIVCVDDSPIVDLLLKDNLKVFSLEREQKRKNLIFRSSRHLLTHPKTLAYIKKQTPGRTANLLFFKPFFDANLLIKKAQGGFQARILNTSPQINKMFENKVSSFLKTKNLKINLPQGVVLRLREASYKNLAKKLGEKMVVQFGRGWAGNTTYFVESEEDLKRVQSQNPHPHLLVKICQFIEGETLTNNACVGKFGTLSSDPFWQITGIGEFTKSPGGTCGNEWSAVSLSPSVRENIFTQTEIFGEFMYKNGFRGYFGLDIIVKRQTDNIYISENNARLTASTPMYTQLEILDNRIPLIVFHLLEFLGRDYVCDFQSLKSSASRKVGGGQIVVRNTKDAPLKIKETFAPGIYKWEEKRGLDFLRSSFRIADLKEKDEFLIFAADKGRIVNPGIEYLRIQSRDSLLNNQGRVAKHIFKIVAEIKKQIF